MNGSDGNFAWQDNHEKSPADRAVTVRERALIKGPTLQLRLGSFFLNDPARLGAGLKLKLQEFVARPNV